jgi:DNA-binding XRE family transcriptional regulator
LTRNSVSDSFPNNEEIMAHTKLNHEKVKELMSRDLLRPADLAKKIGKDRQTVNYILYWGGAKYAEQLARVFGCKKSELLVMTAGRN